MMSRICSKERWIHRYGCRKFFKRNRFGLKPSFQP
ncbi:MAG: sarcosine oxidase subunit delta [Akkermansiaceae bacterium]|nr:sarcosine oxidase subunit delta [Akkermansiaceae bacterium]